MSEFAIKPEKYSALHWSERKALRLRYIEAQGGKCQHCQRPLAENPPPEINDYEFNLSLFPDTMFNWPVHLHHDHNTDLTIGAVHAKCNAWLWQERGE